MNPSGRPDRPASNLSRPVQVSESITGARVSTAGPSSGTTASLSVGSIRPSVQAQTAPTDASLEAHLDISTSSHPAVTPVLNQLSLSLTIQTIHYTGFNLPMQPHGPSRETHLPRRQECLKGARIHLTSLINTTTLQAGIAQVMACERGYWHIFTID